MLSQFLFVEFAEGQPVEVLRVGEFIDRRGREITVTSEDLDTFVANFEAGAAGQEVPVDIGHERNEAAGWLKQLWRADDRLLALPDWNELGKKLVRERIYRYLSATIDMAQKFIKSVSLVNFPAVKGLKPVELSEGIYTLQAENWIETLAARIAEILREVLGLSPGEPTEPMPEETVEEAEFVIRKEGSEIILYSADGSKVLGRFPFGSGEQYASEEAAREAAQEREKEINRIKHAEGGEQGEKQVLKLQQLGIEGSNNDAGGQMSSGDQEENSMTEEELQELRDQIRGEVLAELEQRENDLVELREQVRGEVEAELAARFERRQDLVEFSQEICGGDGVVLSAKPDDVVAFLEGLDDEQVEVAKGLLKAKVVELGERGSSREGKPTGKKELPVEYARMLDAGDFKIADLSDPVLNLGDLDQYDLSKWEE